MKTKLTFIRKDNCTIELLIVVQFNHKATLKTQQEVFNAFTLGVTDWVENTEEGKDLWHYSSEDLNIGDLLDFIENKELTKYLRLRGIKKWKVVYELTEQEEISYDKVLANPCETTNH